MSDLGLTHVALPVRDVDASVAFYARYAGMKVVHRRQDAATSEDVVWISDGTRPFVIVLIGVADVPHPLLPLAHLGVGCATREEVDRFAEEAQAEGRAVYGPHESPPPVGYFVLISDPDDHTLELSYGQEVGLTVEQASEA